jgi:hypothetical protein
MTALFTRMTPPQRKEYAQMHKNDPYTISLLMGINAQEKALRSAMQGAAQGQQGQPPTVVDQQLAQMGTPSAADTGIGTLPQQPMQMAEGGIVAFADGGTTQAEETARRARAFEQYKTDMQSRPQTDPLGLYGAYTGAKDFLSSMTEDPRLSWNIQKMQDAAAEAAKNTTPYDEKALDAAASASLMDMPARPVTDTTPAVAKAPGTGGGITTVAPRATASPRAPAKQVSFADRMDAGMGKAPDFEARIKENTAAEEKLAREGLARTKEDQAAEMKSMFTGQEDRLAKREAELGKSKDTNIAMALIQGGLSMIKPGPAMQAIASGAMVGTKQYGEGIAQIKASQELLDGARDRIENLRNSATSMNNREIRGEEKGIRDLLARGQREQLAGAEKAYGIKREDMRAAVASDIAVEQAGLDRQNRIAVASMPGDQQRMLTALGGKGGLEAGLTKMQEIQADKTGAAYAKMFTETVAEANKVGAVPPTAAQFAASLRSLAAAMNPNKVPAAVETGAATRS